MKTIPELLAEVPLFADLDDPALTLLSGCGQNVHFDEDQVVFSEGDPSDLFFVIRRGRVAIEVATPRRGPLVVETIGEGDVVGVSWLLPPYRWTFDARAVEATSAVAVDAACLRGKCDDDPVFGYEMYKRFAGLVRDRLSHARLQLLDLYGNDAS